MHPEPSNGSSSEAVVLNLPAGNHHIDDNEHVEDENGNLETLDPLEEEIGLFMAEVIMELEEDETVKVKEHVDMDENAEFGISLDVGLHVEQITDKIIEKFIRDFNEDTLKLDPTLYSYQTEDQEAG